MSATTPAPRDLATTALVLGVLNVVCFGPLTGVPAIVLGHRASGPRATAAIALGVLGSALWAGLAAYQLFVAR